MEIIVQGNGVKDCKPDCIKMNFEFKIKDKDYNNCLDKGAKITSDYIRFLVDKGFKRDDVKTLKFNVSRENVYNEQLRKYQLGDFVYSYKCYAIFDYDLKRMATIMTESAEMIDYPNISVEFSLKDNKKAVNELMTLAYKDAESQASVIAEASGKKLKDCIKTSFEPFTDTLCRDIESVAMFAKCTATSTAYSLEEIFIPEDIHLEFTLYTIWIAE